MIVDLKCPCHREGVCVVCLEMELLGSYQKRPGASSYFLYNIYICIYIVDIGEYTSVCVCVFGTSTAASVVVVNVLFHLYDFRLFFPRRFALMNPCHPTYLLLRCLAYKRKIQLPLPINCSSLFSEYYYFRLLSLDISN